MRGLILDIYIYLISPIFGLIFLAAIAYIVIGWLFAAGVIPQNNMTVRNVWTALHNIFDPMVRPLRRVLPTVGNLDLAFLVFLLLIRFVDKALIPRLILLIPT